MIQNPGERAPVLTGCMRCCLPKLALVQTSIFIAFIATTLLPVADGFVSNGGVRLGSLNRMTLRGGADLQRGFVFFSRQFVASHPRYAA